MLTFLVRYIVVIILHVNIFFTVIPGKVLIISVSGGHCDSSPTESQDLLLNNWYLAMTFVTSTFKR